MSIKLTTTKESSSFVKALVYGDAGVGKTVLCATAPNPIIISAESGLLSLSDHDIPVIEVKSIEDVQEAFQFITEAEEAKGFQTVCLDSISEIAEVMIATYKKEDKEVLENWFNSPTLFAKKNIFKFLIIAFPTINIAALILSSFGLIPVQILFLLLLGALGVVGSHLKKINEIATN